MKLINSLRPKGLMCVGLACNVFGLGMLSALMINAIDLAPAVPAVSPIVSFAIKAVVWFGSSLFIIGAIWMRVDSDE